MKTLSTSLCLVALLAAAAPGQLLINECYTDAVDALEILNAGGAPVLLTGWRVEYGGVNTNQTWTPGTYSFPQGVTIAPGEMIVLRESNSSPSVAPGTQAFTVSQNINWATTSPSNTRGGACILVDSSNQGVDMVRWQNAVPPSSFGATFNGTFLSANPSFSRTDLTDNDDATDWGDEPLDLGNLSQGQLASITSSRSC
jgi:hypothetical protein